MSVVQDLYRQQMTYYADWRLLRDPAQQPAFKYWWKPTRTRVFYSYEKVLGDFAIYGEGVGVALPPNLPI